MESWNAPSKRWSTSAHHEVGPRPYLVGKDGKTAYERLKDKASKMLGIGFAETVMFRRVPLHGKLTKPESLLEKGILAGYQAQSGEYMVICDSGVYKTRTFRRIPKEERWDRAAVEEVRFTPWMIKERSAKDELNGSQEQEHKASVVIEINKDIEVELKLPSRHVVPTPPRRVYITKAVVEKFGGTDGCLGCTTALLEGTGVAHNEQCRECIEKLMWKDPSEKERWCTATRRRQELVKKYGLKRMNEELREGFMNHGENDPDEPVRKRARHEDGLTPRVSSTDPIAPQTTMETGEEETSASGHKRCIDEDRDESATKIRRNGTGRGRDGHEDREMLVIMDLMCEEATEDHKEIDD